MMCCIHIVTPRSGATPHIDRWHLQSSHSENGDCSIYSNIPSELNGGVREMYVANVLGV